MTPITQKDVDEVRHLYSVFPESNTSLGRILRAAEDGLRTPVVAVPSVEELGLVWLRGWGSKQKISDKTRAGLEAIHTHLVAASKQLPDVGAVQRVDDDTILVNGELFHATEKHGLVVTPAEATEEYEPQAKLMAACHYDAEHALLNRLIRMLAAHRAGGAS